MPTVTWSRPNLRQPGAEQFLAEIAPRRFLKSRCYCGEPCIGNGRQGLAAGCAYPDFPSEGDAPAAESARALAGGQSLQDRRSVTATFGDWAFG
ncbi:hypothetical protein ACRAWD_21805 [Caulobacter segnis]